MPPKGWRKNAEGQYPQPSKESELVSIDDILFPKATVGRLAKAITHAPDADNMILAKDSLLAVQRSATVFVSHVMFHARQIAREHDRKTVSSQDVVSALERAEFGGFTLEVKQRLTSFEADVADKKKRREANTEVVEEGEAAKRARDNTGAPRVVETEGEVEADADGDADGDAETEVHGPEDADEGDVAEAVVKNPIALLNEDYDEQAGQEAEEKDAARDDSDEEEHD